MTQEDNLYKVLGVNASASQSEIKEAYRKLSMKSNPNKRSRYDIMINLVRISGPNIQVVDDDKGIKFDIKQGMGTVTITSK